MFKEVFVTGLVPCEASLVVCVPDEASQEEIEDAVNGVIMNNEFENLCWQAPSGDSLEVCPPEDFEGLTIEIEDCETSDYADCVFDEDLQLVEDDEFDEANAELAQIAEEESSQ